MRLDASTHSRTIPLLAVLGGLIAAGPSCQNDNVHKLQPNIEVTPDEIDFGSVTVGITEDRTLTITNVGGATLTVDSVVMQDGNRGFDVEAFQGELSPDAGVQLLVTFAPLGPGDAEDLILVASDDPDEPEVQVPVFALDVVGDDDVSDDDIADDDTSDDDIGDDDTSPAPSTGDAMPDWVAAGALTYDHTTGGGAFNNRDVGNDEDIVNSLDGTDFACGDIVTFFQSVVIDQNPQANDLTLETEIVFECNPTGQAGVAFADVTLAQPNYGVVQNGEGPGGTDSGMNDDGGSTVNIIHEYLVPVGTLPFAGADEVYLNFTVDDLEAGESVIVRVDTWLVCDPGANPSGTISAEVSTAKLVAAGGIPVVPPVELNVGTQAIPLGQLGQLGDQ